MRPTVRPAKQVLNGVYLIDQSSSFNGDELVNLQNHRQILPAYGFLCALGMAPLSLHADVNYYVNSVVDDIDDDTGDGFCHTAAGLCTLRAAVMQANKLATPEFAIINVPPGVYVLTIPPSGIVRDSAGDLNLTAPLSINQRIIVRGLNAATTIIDGNLTDRVFDVAPMRNALLRDLTIRRGNNFFGGGGVENSGNLTIFNCIIENNNAHTNGGGVNSAIAASGLRIVQTTIRANHSDSSGGGIAVFGPATIRDSTVSANSANDGGGVYNNGQLNVTNSTFSGNTANNNGGGIYNRINAYVYSTTVVDNDADDDHDENGGIGGGVYNEPGAGSRFVLTNSLIANNFNVAYVNTNDCSGTFEVHSRNLFVDVVGCSFVGGDPFAHGFVSANTIGPLQDNGGATFTHALLPGSQAINGSLLGSTCPDETGTPLPFDQRGAARIVNSLCDIGALEFGAVAPPVGLILKNGFE
jgi:CSLREA domain-containing protein